MPDDLKTLTKRIENLERRNKVYRQRDFVLEGVVRFMRDELRRDIVDDGNVEEFAALLRAAIKSAAMEL